VFLTLFSASLREEKVMRRCVVLTTLLLLLAPLTTAHALSFVFQTIDPPTPFFTIISYGINDSGTVSGLFTDSGLHDHGFLFDGATLTAFDHPSADATKVFAVRGTIAGGLNNVGPDRWRLH
jgi:hypothetical protein